MSSTKSTAKPQIHTSTMTRLGDLKPAGYNPRDITEAAKQRLKRSIGRFGLVENLVANKRTGLLVGGHQRFDSLVAMFDGDLNTEIPVTWLDLSDDEEKALNVALNGEYGGFNEKKLSDVLGDLEKSKASDILSSTGLSKAKITDILDSVGNTPDILAKPDPVDGLRDVPEEFEEGRVANIDGHVLACGDSTNVEFVKAVMDGNKAQMVFFDPPYMADYNPKDSQAQGFKKGREKVKIGEIKNDALPPEEWEALVVGMLNVAKSVLTSDGVIYCCIGQKGLLDMLRFFELAGIHVSSVIIWDKGRISQGRQDYRPQYECIVYGWPKKQTHRPGRSRSESDLWTIPKDSVIKYIHPSQKPVAVYSRAMRNSTMRGEIVVDLCAGSGGLLIASEKLNRKSYSFDLDPRHCDAILARYRKEFDA